MRFKFNFHELKNGVIFQNEDVKVAYKPQYLDYSENHMLVIDFLADAISKYNNQLIPSNFFRKDFLMPKRRS